MSRAAEEVSALLALGRPADAAARAGELLAQNPDDVVLLLNAARAWSRIGNRESATWALAAALHLRPDDPMALRVASECHTDLGDHEIAYDLGYAATASDPGDVDHLCRLAYAGARAPGEHPHRVAVWAGSQAVQLAPTSADAHNAHGVALLGLPDSGAAIASFRRALSLRPEEPVFHRNLGIALAAHGKRREASRHFVIAGTVDPTDQRNVASLRRLDSLTTWGFMVVAAVLGGVGLATALLLGNVMEHRLPDDASSATRTAATLGMLVATVAAVAAAYGLVALVRRLHRRLTIAPDARRILETDSDLDAPRRRRDRR
ncbi:MAG: hypothetical protein U0Q22_16955 [Acidimicrobiales bacterium]